MEWMRENIFILGIISIIIVLIGIGLLIEMIIREDDKTLKRLYVGVIIVFALMEVLVIKVIMI